MLRNRHAKDIGGIGTGQKIIHNKPQEGVVSTPSLGIGGLTASFKLVMDSERTKNRMLNFAYRSVNLCTHFHDI